MFAINSSMQKAAGIEEITPAEVIAAQMEMLQYRPNGAEWAAPAKMLGHKGHLPLRSTDATDQTVSVARVRQQREAPMRTKKATAPKDGRMRCALCVRTT